jgi:hypothetical protein
MRNFQIIKVLLKLKATIGKLPIKLLKEILITTGTSHNKNLKIFEKGRYKINL